MSKREFILGMCIITACITFWTIIDEPVIESTAKVRIVKIEEVGCTTDKEGNVKVYEK